MTPLPAGALALQILPPSVKMALLPMSTIHLLKAEINQTLESLHDFAKWKLIVTSALAAAAFGLTSSSANSQYWFLLFIPYACAYIDLNCYQYLIRITVLARSLRDPANTDADLVRYEALCDGFRKRGVFSLGEYAQVAVSLAISLVAPPFAVIQFRIKHQPIRMWLSIIFWLLGMLAIVVLWRYYKRKNALADPPPPKNQAIATS
jgi:hypothetical protein